MNQPTNPGRRTLLRELAAGLSLASLAALESRSAFAADVPLLGEADPAARAVQYVEDASRAKSAQSGANCSNCALYDTASAAAVQGKCSLFPGKLVKAAGWCSSWTTL